MRRRTALLLAVAATATVGTGCSAPKVDPRNATRPVGPFWVDPASQAARHAATEPGVARIAAEPMALTLTGARTDAADLVRAVAGARTAKRTLVLQVYDLPHRDVGAGYSAGGAPTAAAYRAVTASVAAAISGVPTVVVLEPDSLGQLTDLAPADQQVRYELLRDAVEQYSRLERVAVYLDGTHSDWLSAEEMARRLGQAGVGGAQGFAVNVANFQETGAEGRRAEQISDLTGGAHYLVDTSRNGLPASPGDGSSWCNPPGRRLGEVPTTRTGFPRADGYLWIKRPGESDGSCGPGQPPAGQWYPAAAAELLGRDG